MMDWPNNPLRLLCLVAVFLVILVPPIGLAQEGAIDSRTFCFPMEVHQGAPEEKPCLSQFEKIAERHGKALTLKLNNGKTKVIRDSKECNDPRQEADCVSYRLVGYIGDKHFIVSVQPYECATVLLVSRQTGKETELLGWPILSPNKKRFVVTPSTVDRECDRAYAVAVFSLINDLPKLEWQSESPANVLEFEYDGWDGDNKVLLQALDSATKKRSSAQLTLTAQGWQLMDERGK